MRILIATGIYPPAIGGPAQYAYNMKKEFESQGHMVEVKYFGKIEKILPTGLRHLYFLLKTIIAFLRADFVLVLDTFSVAGPVYFLSRLFYKGYVIRTGGDFLWENYVERTGKKILLKDFYTTEIPYFSSKEKMIYSLTGKILRQSSHIVFSTDWQKNIFTSAYKLDGVPMSIIENYYNIPLRSVESPTTSSSKIFITSTRDLKWKNKDIALKYLKRLQADFPEENIVIDNNTYSHGEFLEKVKNGYAVVLLSLGDISPNMILDAISQGTPFLLTSENGISDRVRTLGLLADPLDENDIYNKLKDLLRPEIYAKLKEELTSFTHTHSWKDIYTEFMQVYAHQVANRPPWKIFKFFKNIFSVGVAQTFSSIGAFIVNILMANVLPAYSYGTYKFLTSWVSLLTISSLPQVQYSYGNAVARGQRGGYKNIVIQKIKYGLIGSSLALIMSIYYTVMNNSTLSISFFVIAVLIPFLDPLTLYNGYFQGTREYIRNAKLLIIQSLITYLLIIGVFLYTQSIPILIGSYLLAWILPRLPINIKLGKLSGPGNETEVKEVVTYGKKLTLYDSILYVTQFADKLVLFYLLGAREVAVYAIAVAFPDQIKSYVKNIYFMLQARFATSSFARIFSNTKKITALSIVGLILITIIYMLCASFLLKIFFPTYTDAIYISIIYSISIVSAIYTIPSLAIRANNNEKELLKINAFRGLTYCALVVSGTVYFGLIGAVVGKVIGDYIYAISYYVMMYKISNRIPVNTNNN